MALVDGATANHRARFYESFCGPIKMFACTKYINEINYKISQNVYVLVELKSATPRTLDQSPFIGASKINNLVRCRAKGN